MLKICTLENREEWDNIVSSFANYDVYYLSGYIVAFKLHGDGEPLLLYYESEGLKGINVVMKRDIADIPELKDELPKGTLFDFSTPYGYGGWLIEGEMEKSDLLFKEYQEWCAENHIVCEFVRYHPLLENYNYANSAYDIIMLGNTITLDISSPEVIWQNITSKNRNVIRKAEKSGVEIKMGNSPEIYEKFIEIYNKTMEHDNADGYYFFGEDFYESIRNDLPQNSLVFYAEKDGEIIAASIMIYEDGKLNYHLSGSLFEYRTFAPSNLLLYKAALWGSDNGFTTFHLGGGVGSKEDSLFKFKKSFYRQDDLTRFAIGKKVFLQEEYDRLVKIKGNIDSNFFPKYRA
ncbi:MAG: peptidoglycan bridge formation glycyltransferase FemA/FemB family protein [Clostridia bacterium]|nr:peptidoglycan bridge formation glycyltransferase FemA/FemB family protein [Clostridia bacterium]